MLPQAMKLYAAPMAGYTNYAFRELLRMFGGADVLTTEMIAARSFAAIANAPADFHENRLNRLYGIKDEPRPLSVQIWDNNPDTLAFFAHCLATQYNVPVIDLNFGCPAKQIAGKSESGSYLLQFPDRIGNLIEGVVKAVNNQSQITAKIRLGRTRDTINAVDVAQAVEGAGAAAITVHGRCASDMYRGQADWEEIAKIKPKLKSIPLIGNGDIRTVEDALFRIRTYPVDGIMIGRGCVAQPWIFRAVKAAFSNGATNAQPSNTEMAAMIHQHYETLQKQFKDSIALTLVRKIVYHQITGQKGARVLRCELSAAKDADVFFRLVNNYFGVQ